MQIYKVDAIVWKTKVKPSSTINANPIVEPILLFAASDKNKIFNG